MKRTTISLSDEQYEYIQKKNLKSAWIFQDAITKRMEGEIKTSADLLKEQGYLSFEQYKQIIDDFEQKIGDAHEELTIHELKRERRRMYDLWRRSNQINKKIKDEIAWIDIQLGNKKPGKKGVFKFNIEQKL